MQRKKLALVAGLLIVLMASTAYAAIVFYLSNVVTKPVSVESPIELSGAITYSYMAWTEISDDVDVGLARDDKFLYLFVDVEEEEETFLLVFMDTAEGGTIYDYPGTGRGIWADYEITDPAVGTAWEFWYLSKWMTFEDAYTWSVPDISYFDYEWGVWNCEGFEADESRNEEYTHYNFVIPLECIEFDVEYGLNLFVHTGAGMGDWVTPKIGTTVTESFDGALTVPLYKCSEFFLTFRAKNLGNTPIPAPLALVIKNPSVWTDPEWELEEPCPFSGDWESFWIPDHRPKYLVLGFDGLDVIEPGGTNELTIWMALSGLAEPGPYEFRAVVLPVEFFEFGLSDEEILDAILEAVEL